MPEMNWLTLITGILNIGPQFVALVNNTVVEVENALGNLPGAQKFAAVEAKINSFLQTAEADAEAIANIQGILPALINGAVAMFNAAKVFTSKTAAPAPTPTAPPTT
jgi:hypothetical protein